MNDSKVAPEEATRQADPPETRKIGVEILRSVDLPSRFFKSWRAASYSPGDDLWSRRLKRAMR